MTPFDPTLPPRPPEAALNQTPCLNLSSGEPVKVAAARLMRLAAEVMPEERAGFVRVAGRHLTTTRASLAALAPLVEANPRQEVPEDLLAAGEDNPFGGLGEGRPSVGAMAAHLLKAASWSLERDPELAPGAELYALAADLLAAAPGAMLDGALVELWPYLERVTQAAGHPVIPVSKELRDDLLAEGQFAAIVDRVRETLPREAWSPTDSPARMDLARVLAPVWLSRRPVTLDALPEAQIERLIHAASAPRMAWAAPPMIAGDWTTLPPADAAVILTLVGETVRLGEKRWPITLEHACDRVRTRPVACHGGGLLIEIQGYGDGAEPGLMSALMVGERLFLADGTSAPLHHATDAAGVKLDGAQARRDFLVLFAGWVSSDEGRFHILTTPDDLAGRYAGGPELWPKVAGSIEPLVDLGRGEDGRWGFDATVLYGRDLYRARFKMNELGQVTMTDERPVMSDLPVLLEVRDGPLVHLRAAAGEA